MEPNRRKSRSHAELAQNRGSFAISPTFEVMKNEFPIWLMPLLHPFNFKLLKKIIDKEMPDLFFGAGTIKNISEAETFVDAGAEFIVSPIVNAELSKIASKYKMLCIPGCMTPTEIYQAQKNGAELVKIFPANILGPQYISSIRDLFPDLLFFPTGGVEINQENMEEWFNSGVCAVGLGSKLISKEVLKNKLYDKLYEDTVLVLKFAKKAKK